MRYFIILLLFVTWSNLSAQFYQLDVFDNERGSLQGNRQFDFFRPLSNQTIFVSFYGEKGLYLFDGHRIFPVDTSVIPNAMVSYINNEYQNECIVVFEKEKQKLFYSYNVELDKWLLKGSMDIKEDIMFYNNSTYFWRNDSLYLINGNSYKFIVKGGAMNIVCVVGDKIYYVKKGKKNMECRLPNGDILSFPVPPIEQFSHYSGNDDFFLIANNQDIYQLNLKTPNAVWKRIYHSNSTISNLNYDKEEKAYLFSESISTAINQYNIVVLNTVNQTFKKYSYRWTEGIIYSHSIQRDSLGKFWILTPTAILRLNPFTTILEPQKDNYPGNVWTTATATNGQTVLAAYQANQPLAIYDKGQIHLDYDYINRIREQMKNPIISVRPFISAKSYKDRLLIPMESPAGILEYHTKKGFIDFHKMENPSFIAYQSSYSGRWFFGQNRNTILRTKNSTVGRGYDTLKLEIEMIDAKILGLCEDKYERLWVASKGIHVFEKNSKTQNASYFKTDGFMSICTDNWGGLWVGGTNSNKLLWAKLQSNKLPKEAEFKKFNFAMVTSLSIVQDTFLFIGGEDQICILHLPNFHKTGVFLPRYLINNDGNSLIRIEQNCFNIDKDGWLWIADTRGYIMRIEPTKAWQTAIGRFSPPKAFFVTATYDNQINYLKEKSSIHLKKNSKRSILFMTSVTENIGFVYNIQYKFQLKKGQEIMTDTTVNNNYFVFNGLEYGNYTVSVAAVLPDGVVGDFLEMPFEVEATFWEVWEGFVLFFIALLVLIIMIMFLRGRKKQEMIETTKKENNIWFTAMFNGQMNIHFLGNSIETIKSLIKSNLSGINIFTTALYKLSVNIWTVAECARQGSVSHSLEQELKLIRNNLWLYEKIYPEAFKTYYLPDETKISHLLNINVPLQSILVHTDNAIEHGIKSLEEVYCGEIWVDISENEDYLIIKIKDNGIGREQAKKIGSKGNQKAESLQNKLSERFNVKNKLPIKREHNFLDPFNRTGNITLIYIPKEYNYGY